MAVAVAAEAAEEAEVAEAAAERDSRREAVVVHALGQPQHETAAALLGAWPLHRWAGGQDTLRVRCVCALCVRRAYTVLLQPGFFNVGDYTKRPRRRFRTRRMIVRV